MAEHFIVETESFSIPIFANERAVADFAYALFSSGLYPVRSSRGDDVIIGSAEPSKFVTVIKASTGKIFLQYRERTVYRDLNAPRKSHERKIF